MDSGRSEKVHRAALSAAVIGTGAILVALGTGRGGHLFGSAPWRVSGMGILASGGLGAVVVAVVLGLRAESTPQRHGRVLPRGEAAVLVMAAVVAVVPHLLGVRWFDSPAREDNVVEWVSAIAAASASVCVVVASRGRPLIERLCLLAAAPVLFVMAGEEVSWLQRIIGYGTPELFSGSSQGEVNLHNLSTDRFQSAFYLGGCAFLVLLPHLARWAPRTLGHVREIVPGRLSVTLGSVAVAFTYARTGNLVHHLTVWVVVAVLLAWSGPERPWALATLAVVVTCQALVAAAGPDLIRPWAPAEYREMFIALGLAAWAVPLAFGDRSRDVAFTGSSHAATRAAPSVGA